MLLTVEQIFIRPGQKRLMEAADEIHGALKAAGGDDFNTLLHVYNTFRQSDRPKTWCRDNFVHFRSLSTASKVRDQLEQILSSQTKHTGHHAGKRRRLEPSSERDAVRKALCFGYFDHVVRQAGTGFRTMDGHGSTVYVHPSSGLFETQQDHEWIIFHEVVRTSKTFMRTLTPIRYEWVKVRVPL